MGSAPDTGEMTMLALTVLGGAASNVIVTPIANAIWKDDKEKARTNGAYVKCIIGLTGIMYAENEMLQAASLGMLVAGGSEVLQAKVEAFRPKLMSGVGEIIELSGDQWYDIAGVESDNAVAGGVY